MAKINLLPWREELRQRRQREFVTTLAGAAVVMLGVIFLVHQHIEGLITNQKSRNVRIEAEIKQVDKEIAEIRELAKNKANLLARMRVIEQLQRSRPEAVHLFEEVAKTTPDGVFISSLSHQVDTITIAGKAQSNAQVSSYMRNVDQSEWLTNPTLNVIKAEGRNLDRTLGFNLIMKQTRPDANKEEGGQ